MQTAMQSIKEMVDVNTILGDPVETPDGSVILPVSRISLGFAAGGTEYETEHKRTEGGQGQGRLLPVDGSAIYDRLIDLAPRLVDRIAGSLESRKGGASGAQPVV